MIAADIVYIKKKKEAFKHFESCEIEIENQHNHTINFDIESAIEHEVLFS